MTTWNDEDIQERLDELVDLTPEELSVLIPPLARARVEAYLDLDRHLQSTELPVPLPPDFAVRIAEETGVLRPPRSPVERWSVGIAIGLSGIVGIVALTRVWGVFAELIASSTLVAGFRGDIAIGLFACCCAFIVSLVLDRGLRRIC